MQKPRPIITEQRREDVRKVSDLIEVAGSRTSLSRWCVDGVEYVYVAGDLRVTVCPVRNFNTRTIRLDTPTKTAAKKAIFEDLRA